MNYKIITIILLLELMTSFSHAQVKNIGLKKTDIMNVLLKDYTKEFASVGTSSDGLNYMLYRDKEYFNLLYVYYFDSSGICVSYAMIWPSINYPNVVKTLNDEFSPVGNDTWEDTSNHFTITVRPIPNSTTILVQYSKKGYFTK